LKAVDELVVRWPSGVVDRIRKPPLRQIFIVQETEGFSISPKSPKGP
jgi:hypothetical protein